MRVSCDETHLHYIQPYQFVDSPEWEANREQSDDVFQVYIPTYIYTYIYLALYETYNAFLLGPIGS